MHLMLVSRSSCWWCNLQGARKFLWWIDVCTNKPKSYHSSSRVSTELWFVSSVLTEYRDNQGTELDFGFFYYLKYIIWLVGRNHFFTCGKQSRLLVRKIPLHPPTLNPKIAFSITISYSSENTCIQFFFVLYSIRCFIAMPYWKVIFQVTFIFFLCRCPDVNPTSPCVCAFAPIAAPDCRVGADDQCFGIGAICCPDGCGLGRCRNGAPLPWSANRSSFLLKITLEFWTFSPLSLCVCSCKYRICTRKI